MVRRDVSPQAVFDFETSVLCFFLCCVALYHEKGGNSVWYNGASLLKEVCLCFFLIFFLL